MAETTILCIPEVYKIFNQQYGHLQRNSPKLNPQIPQMHVESHTTNTKAKGKALIQAEMPKSNGFILIKSCSKGKSRTPHFNMLLKDSYPIGLMLWNNLRMWLQWIMIII